MLFKHGKSTSDIDADTPTTSAYSAGPPQFQ